MIKLQSEDTASCISDSCHWRKTLRQRMGTGNIGELSGSRKALSSFVPGKWWFIKICYLRVKLKQSHSFCNVSLQPSLILFHLVLKTIQRKRSIALILHYLTIQISLSLPVNSMYIQSTSLPLCITESGELCIFFVKKETIIFINE